MPSPRNQSIQRAFAILRQFHGTQERLSAAEVIRRSGLPTATGYRMVATLADIGAVVRTRGGAYRLGGLFPREAKSVSADPWLPAATNDVLDDLAVQFRMTDRMASKAR